MKLTVLVVLLLAIGLVGYGAFREAHILSPSHFSSTNVTPSSTPSNTTYPLFQQGIYVVNSTVYLVYYSQFSQIRIGNTTFIHGGPIMAGFNGVYLVENSTPLNLNQVQIYNGSWFNVSLPIFHQGPGAFPRGTLYPAGSVIPL
ncbi:MAG: hypothetical protein OWQ52_02035 [Metallosphaera prunae]|uniref:hypothetical protein n=1 Tax=Metallosphaera prunae TaxID=47304 RepID=UPI00227395DE|nr:hypothetical protein [Metallosphaera prunae]MCY0861186.1 hypothetical protein [Metallosphaera prunae]